MPENDVDIATLELLQQQTVSGQVDPDVLERAQKPSLPGMVGAWDDHVVGLRAAAPTDPSLAEHQVDAMATDVLGPARTLAEWHDHLNRAGIDRGADFGRVAEEQAVGLYMDLIGRHGFRDAQGPGVPEARQNLLDAARVFVRVRNSGLYGPDRRPVSSAALDSVVDRFMTRSREQLGQSPSQDLVAEHSLKQTLANRIKALSVEGKDLLVRAAIARSVPQPVNEMERAAMSAFGTDNWLITTVAGGAAELSRQRFEADREAFVSGKWTVEEAMTGLRALLGNEAEAHLAAEFEEHKVRYLVGRVGATVLPDGRVAQGTTSDGGPTVWTFTSPGTLEILTRASTALTPEGKQQLVESYPDVARDVSSLYVQGRGTEARVIIEELATRTLARVAEMDAIALGRRVQPSGEPYTPYELSQASLLQRAAASLQQTVGAVWNWAAQGGRALDERLADVPYVRELAQMNTWALAGNAEGVERTVGTVGDAARVVFRLWMDAGGQTGLKGIQAVRELPELRALSPEGKRAVLFATNRPLEIGEASPAATRAQDDRVRRLNDTMNRKRPFEAGQVLSDLTLASAHQAIRGIIEPFYDFVSDPRQAPAMAAGAYLGGRAGALTTRHVEGMLDRVLSAHRLRHQLRQLATHFPQVATRVHEATGRALEDALRSGRPEVVTARLRAAAAATEVYLKEFRTTGTIKGRGEFAVEAARLWPEISEHLGDLGQALGSRAIAPSLVETAKGVVNRILGREGRPDSGLLTLAGDLGGLDITLDGINALLGTGAAGERLRNGIAAFREANGRMPTEQEIQTLVPESVLDLQGLLLQAGKLDLRAGPARQLLQRFFPRMRDPGAVLAGVVDSVDGVVTAGVQAAIDDVALARQWGLTRRRNDVLLSTAAEALRQRLGAAQLWDMAAEVLGEAIPGQRAAIGRQVEVLRQRASLLETARQRLGQHSPRQRWEMPEAVRAAVFEEIDEGALGVILELHPTLFEGWTREGLYIPSRTQRVVNRRIQADINAARLDAGVAQVELDADLRQPDFRRDSEYRALVERAREVDSLLDVVRQRGEPPNPTLLNDRRALRLAAAARARGIRRGELESSWREYLRTQVDQARNWHARLVRHQRTVLARPDEQFSPARFQEFVVTMQHGGASQFLRGARAALEVRLKSAAAAKEIGAAIDNPFTVAALPVHLRGAVVEQMVRNTMLHIASKGTRLEELMAARDRMTAPERARLDEALATGVAPARLYKKYPEVARLYRSATGRGVEHPDPVQAYFESETGEFATYLESLRAVGRVPEAVWRELQNEGYDPQLYGLFERPKVITERLAKERMAVAGGRGAAGGGQFGPRTAGEALAFRRALNEWRVRIEEPQRVVDRLFKTREEAMGFLRDRYGEDVEGFLEKPTEKLQRGKTPFGDPITLAEPIGRKALEILDPVLGHTAEKRLVRLYGAHRDLAIHNLSDAMNLAGGLVLDEGQMTALKAAGNDYVTSRFVRIPDNATAYGTLAGKWVHQSVMGTMRRAARTFESLDAFLDGVRGAYLEAGQKLPEVLVQKAAGKVEQTFRAFHDITVNNQVVTNLSTWVTNLLNLVFSDYLTKAGVFTSDGLPTLKWALREALPDKAAMHRNPTFLTARRHGLITGLISKQAGEFRPALIEMFGLDHPDTVKMQAMVGRRKAMLSEMYQARIEGDSRRIVEMEKDVAALDAALREKEKGWMRRTARWWTEAFLGLGVKDNLGRPVNRWSGKLKGFYNYIDEFFKLAEFARLSRVLPEKLAVRRVRMFSQMYQEVPYYLRAIPHWLRSTIVSFPFEAGRVLKNALLHEPAATAAFFSVVPMLNLANMTRAGISPTRMEAILDARGAKDGVTALSKMMFSLWFPNPHTGNIDAELDLGGVFALGGLVRGRGLISQAFNDWVPPENRTALQSGLGAGVGFVSNFFFNNTPFNFIGHVATGRDPLSGREILEPDAPLRTRLGQATKILWQSVVPPVVPGGRQWEAIVRAQDAPTNPRTGRPYRRPWPITEVTRALTGIGLKGDLSRREPLVDDADLALSAVYRVASQLAPGPAAPDAPVESDLAHKRELLYRAWDEETEPEARARAWKEFAEFANERAEVDLGFLKGVRGPTERQIATEVLRIKQFGIEDFFGQLPIHAQAAALVQMDRAGVGGRFLGDLAAAARFTNDGRLNSEEDPGLVQEAIRYLREGTRWPAHNRQLDELLYQLENWTLPMATMSREQERALLPLKLMQEERGAALRKEMVR